MLRGWRGRIGLITPASGRRDYEFIDLLPEGVAGFFTRVPYYNGAEAEDYLALGDETRLVEAAALLGGVGLDVVTWADTSASFIFGLDGARRQADKIGEAAGCPGSSTSLALLAACEHLGIHSLAVVGPYRSSVNEALRSFLAQGGIEIASLVTLAEQDPDASLSPEVMRRQALAAGLAGDALFIPGTDMPAAEFINSLEEDLGKPVLTAIQVTVWDALRLIGVRGHSHEAGILMR